MTTAVNFTIEYGLYIFRNISISRRTTNRPPSREIESIKPLQLIGIDKKIN